MITTTEKKTFVAELEALAREARPAKDHDLPETPKWQRCNALDVLPVQVAAVGTIELHTPGGGVARVLNTRDALMHVARAWRAMPSQKVTPKKPRKTHSAKPPRLGECTETAARKIAAGYVCRDTGRDALLHAQEDGLSIVATEGRRLIRITGEFAGTPEAPVYTDVTGRAGARNTDGMFPDWHMAIPPADGRIVWDEAVDTAAAFQHLSAARHMVNDRFSACRVHYDRRGGVCGYAVLTPEVGECRIGDTGADILCGISVAFLRQAMGDFRKLGYDTVRWETADTRYPDHQPQVLTSTDGRVTIVIMPVRL